MDQAVRRRLTLAGLLCIPFGLYGWAIFVSTAIGWDGAIGPHYHAPGTDWTIFYTAARAWYEGHLARIYDQIWLRDALNTSLMYWMKAPMADPAFHYPPPYLLLLLPFGAFSFAVSYVLAQVASLAGLAAVLRKAFAGPMLPFLLASLLLSPAASNTVISGQNAFAVCAVLVLGMSLLERRPALAGLVLGLLSLKPQFGLMVPVALVAARQWRALAAAGAMSLMLALASLLVFGLPFWQAWFDLFLHPRSDVAHTGIDWGRMWDESVFTCAALLGAARPLADAIQAAAILIAASFVYVSYYRTKDNVRSLCVLLAAAVVASPHVSPYDMILLALAASLHLWRVAQSQDFRPIQMLLPLALWLAPLFNPPRVVSVGLVTPVLVLAFCALVSAPLLSTREPAFKPV